MRCAYNTQSEGHGICPRRCWKMGASNSWRNVSNGLFSWDKCPPLGIEQSGRGGKGGWGGEKMGRPVTKILRPMLTELTNWGIRCLQTRPKKPCPNLRFLHTCFETRELHGSNSKWLKELDQFISLTINEMYQKWNLEIHFHSAPLFSNRKSTTIIEGEYLLWTSCVF